MKAKSGKVTPAVLRRLLSAAVVVRQRSYSPYSHFRVGAAILASDGRVYAGCNVENSSYGLSLCAERNAVGQAVARGAKNVVAVAVVTQSKVPSPPCGMCLQTLSEFAERSLPILLGSTVGKEEIVTLGDLLPRMFDKSYLLR